MSVSIPCLCPMVWDCCQGVSSWQLLFGAGHGIAVMLTQARWCVNPAVRSPSYVMEWNLLPSLSASPHKVALISGGKSLNFYLLVMAVPRSLL